MAHHLFINKDPLRTCPYDPSHRVCTSRIQGHLVKCRRNHPDAPIKICPFNATHHIPIPEYAAHIVNCPNAEIMDKKTFPDRLEEFPFRGSLTLPAYRNHNLPTDEDWDAELEAQPITQHAQYQPVSEPTHSRGPFPITIPMAARIAASRPTFQEEVPPS